MKPLNRETVWGARLEGYPILEGRPVQRALWGDKGVSVRLKKAHVRYLPPWLGDVFVNQVYCLQRMSDILRAIAENVLGNSS